MKILWIMNQPTVPIARDFNITTGHSGGWMEKILLQIAASNSIAIIFPISRRHREISGEISHNVLCYGVPVKKTALKPHKKFESVVEKVIDSFKPDLIHIWGTEYVHSASAVIASERKGLLEKTVISIQGMDSIISKHYRGFIDSNDYTNSVYDIIKGKTISRQIYEFKKRGLYEIDALKRVKHVIGRTDWDRACTMQINKAIKYHYCGETLRDSFYHSIWEYEKCNRHRVMLSQCQYPIKGFHIALEAIAILKEKYPDILLCTTGPDRVCNTFLKKLTSSSYNLYITKLVKKYNLNNNIKFLGNLSELQMKDSYLLSNVFVSASSIENSPNSVGEAMILGMPVVASDVGGVKNMLTHGSEGYIYPADEPYMLAYYIDEIFSNIDDAKIFGANARNHAMKTHNEINNYNTLINIYSEIVNS